MRLQILLVVLVKLCSTNAYKILIVSPIPSGSHGILGDGFVRHLTKAGHEITYITAFPPKKSDPLVKIIDLSVNHEIPDHDNQVDLDNALEKENGIDLIPMMKIALTMTENTVGSPNVQKLINDETQQFDLVIAEWMLHQVYAGFSAVFNCPYIWFSTVEPHWGVLKLVDEYPNPAYTNDIQSSHIPPFTLFQRIKEVVYLVAGTLVHETYISMMDYSLYEKYLAPAIRNRGRPVPPMDVLKYNASLILGNSHVSLGLPKRLPENYKHIGGYHIDENVKTLPEDLKKLMDEAKHGVIYFSLGSNVKSKTLPKKVKDELLKVFGELKQTVLWKFEEDLPNKPKNVHTIQWAPQQSILAHQNCVIFITHGGLLSTTEAIHFGVPIIGIPIFGDQPVNVERAVAKGFARYVHLTYSLANDLQIAINEVLTDKKYRIKVKQLSLIYHDRPVSPGKELVHWVEHVIKTKGAPHLRSPALMMPWYEKYYVDLVALLIAICFVLRIVLKNVKILFVQKMYIDKKLN